MKTKDMKSLLGLQWQRLKYVVHLLYIQRGGNRLGSSGILCLHTRLCSLWYRIATVSLDWRNRRVWFFFVEMHLFHSELKFYYIRKHAVCNISVQQRTVFKFPSFIRSSSWNVPKMAQAWDCRTHGHVGGNSSSSHRAAKLRHHVNGWKTRRDHSWEATGSAVG